MGAAVLLTAVYARRPDALAALTIVPAWAWFLLLTPLLPFIRRRHLRTVAVCAGAWLVFGLVHVEEPRSVLRGWLSPACDARRAGPGGLRLVTFNCSVGEVGALAEVRAMDPDVVFLQESPPASAVATLAHDLFGGQGASIWGPDTSIVVRGTVRRQAICDLFATVAVVDIPRVGEVQLVSLRLQPGQVLIDFLDPRCWRAQADGRRVHLRQVREILTRVDPARSLMVAGDFNAPQGDRLFRLFPRDLRDTFAAAGRGWGNTILNDLPVLRIDQIWVSPQFTPIQAFAVRSTVSDHRLVVCDVRVRTL